MKSLLMKRYRGALALSIASMACGSGDDDAATSAITRPASPAEGGDEDALGPTEGDEGAQGPGTELAGCVRGTLEADFSAQPLAGATVTDGVPPPGQYVLSTTYLQLARDEASQQLFADLVAAVIGDLQTRPGLVALALGTSATCSVARTLAVWQDEESMYGFVTGPAHAAAMARVTDISRGGSVVTHWLGDETSASWASAAQRIGADEGPLY